MGVDVVKIAQCHSLAVLLQCHTARTFRIGQFVVKLFVWLSFLFQ